MDSLGSNLASVVKAHVESGQDLRVVFDNLDFRILANIILRNHRNSDMHWIAHYVTFERVSSRHLDDSKPIVSDIKDFDNINYLMSKDELEWQRNDYIILVARVLLEFFPSLGPLVMLFLLIFYTGNIIFLNIIIYSVFILWFQK